MALTNVDFQATIGVQDNYSQAVKDAAKSSEHLVSSFGKVSKQVIVLNQALELMGKAWSFISDNIGSVVKEFGESEQAARKLGFAIGLQGENVAQGVSYYQELSSEIQKNTTIADDNVMALAAQSKAMGMNDLATTNLINASVELAAVMGVDVNDAFSQLTGSLVGQTRTLAKYVPDVKAMTQEQLASGEAIRLVADRFKGFAANEATTTLGATKQITNAFGEIKEALGELVVSFLRVNSIDLKSAIVENLLAFADGIRSFAKDLVELRDVIISMLAGIWNGLKMLDWKLVAQDILILVGAFTALAVVMKSAAIISALTAIILNFTQFQLWASIVLTYLYKLAAAWVAQAGAMAIFALKAGVIAVAVVTIATAIDLLVRNFKRLGDLIVSITSKVIGGLLARISDLSKAFGMDKASESIDGLVGKFASMDEEVSAGLDWGFMGKTVDEASKFFANFSQGSDDMKGKLQETNKETLNLNGNIRSLRTTVTQVSDEFKKQLDEINRRYKDNIAFINEAGKTEGEIIGIRTQAQLETIAKLKDELSARGMLTKEISNQLALASQAESARGGAETDKLRAKFLDEIANKNNDIQMSLMQQGATQRQLIKLDQEKQAIELQTFKALAIANGVYNDQLEFSIQKAQTLSNALASAKLAEIPRTFDDVVADAGDAFSLISDDFFSVEGWDLASGVLMDGISQGFSAAAEIMSSVVEDIATASEYIGSLFSGDFINQISGAFASIGDMPKQLLESFQNFGQIVTTMITELPKVVSQLLSMLPQIVTQIVESFPLMIDAIVEAFPLIAQALADAVPQVLQAVFDAIPRLIDMLPAMLDPIIQMIPVLIGKAIDSLPQIIQSLFDAIPQIIGSLIQAVPTVIENLMENFDKIVLSLVDGLLSSMGEIVGSFINSLLLGGGLERIIGALLRAIPKIIIALVQGIARGLANALKGIFGGGMGLTKAPKAMTDLPKKLEGSFKKIGNVLSADASKLFSVKDFSKISKGLNTSSDNVGSTIKEAASDAVKKLGSWWDKFGKGLSDLWKGLIKLLQDAWNVIIELLTGVFNFLREVWLFIYDYIIKPLIDGLRAIWLFIYDYVIKPLIDGIRAVWLFIYDAIIKPAFEMLSTVFNAVMEVLKAVWDGIMANLTAVFNAVVVILSVAWDNLKAAGEAVVSIFKAAWDVFKSIFQTLMDLFQGKISAFEALKEIFSAIFDGAKKVFDALLTLGTKFIEGWQKIFEGLGKVLESFLDGYRKVGETIGAALEAIIGKLVSQITSFAGKIGEALVSVLSSAFSVGSQIVNQIGSTLSSVLTSAVASLSSVFSGLADSFADALKNAFKSILGDKIAGALGLAHGGQVPLYAADGMFVPRGTDTVPAMLTPGEFVVNRSAAQANLGTLAAINAANGRTVASLSGGDVQNQITITINAKTLLDANQIKRDVLPVIDQHLKRRSLDGAFVLSASGVQR